MMLIEKARLFAQMAHTTQQRKYTGEPYYAHLAAVAEMVKLTGARDEMIAAAFLHDTLEDTPVKVEELRMFFGDEVTQLVIELTDVFTSEDYPTYNREHRKRLERERLAGVSADAQTIKVADLIDNTASIVQRDPNFAKVYLREKAALIKVLTKAHPSLLAMVERAVPLG
jgi:guanosine-3',5'-bis(diphosphate) 3'-pyrophosphohydrolase